MLSTLTALAAFLWYRKGRLWSFYDSLLYKSIEQIQSNSIDRNTWEKIEQENYAALQSIFNSLFRFELVYLKYKVAKIKDALWIGYAETVGRVQRTYTNKQQYCKYIVKTSFYSDLRLCGLFLLVNSFKYWCNSKYDEDTGYVDVPLD